MPVTPGSPRTAVGGRRADALVIRVIAKPVAGAATQAALRAAAAAFGVPAADVTLVAGTASHDKVIDIAGNAGDAAPRLDELPGS